MYGSNTYHRHSGVLPYLVFAYLPTGLRFTRILFIRIMSAFAVGLDPGRLHQPFHFRPLNTDISGLTELKY